MLLGPIMTYVALDGFLTSEPVVAAVRTRRWRRIVDYFLAMVEVTP